MKTDRRDAMKKTLQMVGGGVSALGLNATGLSTVPDSRTRSEAGPSKVEVRTRNLPGLVAHWELNGDCQDAGGAHHGEGHDIAFVEGRDGRARGAAKFNGIGSFVEVPDHDELHFGEREFSLALWVNLPDDLASVIGDLLTKYDPDRRKGFNLTISGSSPAYSSVSDARNLQFGIDNAINGSWVDCGRPSKTNPLINTLTVYKGEFYTGIADASKPEDACHVFRYAGGTDWEDCGRLGTHPLTVSVNSMIVHKGHLYGGTGVYDWERANAGVGGPSHVYRYAGGTRWEDCGQIGKALRLMPLASFQGDLYVGGDDMNCYRYESDGKWISCGQLGPKDEVLLQGMTVYRGQLYASSLPAMYRYEGGTQWSCIGRNPRGMTQVHKLQVYNGRLYAGTWPHGKVLRYEGGTEWTECGQLGIPTDQYQIDEVNDLTVYNGKLYAGVLPKAEVYRYEGGTEWTLLRSLVSNFRWSPGDVHTWFRAPCLTSFRGRLHAGTGACFGRYDPEVPPEAGRVHSMEAGKNVSYDDDLGSGWKHVVAVREKGRLKL
ncbi:MAG: hypothetical protein ACE145_21810, partial [Terriglobia bacterium]